MKKPKNDIGEKSIAFHKKHNGKLFTSSVLPIKNKETLSLVYTPGVGRVSSVIAKNPKLARTLTWKGRVVAVISDGTAVLGLGDIGPLAALPVMEGKSILFKELAGVDAVPLVLDEKDPKEIIKIIRAVSPTFGAILLEDFKAPECFEIEKELKEILDIPVLHDDQHGTAMVVLAGLINACKVTKRKFKDISVGIVGAGAAGTAITKLLLASGITDIRVMDRHGVINKKRTDLNIYKKELAKITNPKNINGEIKDGLKNCDVLVGVSGPGNITKEDLENMAENPIIFALANPIPEIMPEEAKKIGARVIATGRSDFPNQVNNALIFPGLFKGMLKYEGLKITEDLMVAVSHSVAGIIKKPNTNNIIPNVFNKNLVPTIMKTIGKYAKK